MQPLSTRPSPSLLPQSQCSSVTCHQRVKRRPVLSPPHRAPTPCISHAPPQLSSWRAPSALQGWFTSPTLLSVRPFPHTILSNLSSLSIALCLYFNERLVYTSPPTMPSIQNRVYILFIFVPLVLPRFNEWTVSKYLTIYNCMVLKRLHSGTSLEVQWLKLYVSNVGAQVWSLVGELRSCMLWVVPPSEDCSFNCSLYNFKSKRLKVT